MTLACSAGKGFPFQAPALVLRLDATAAIFFERNHLPQLPSFKSCTALLSMEKGSSEVDGLGFGYDLRS